MSGIDLNLAAESPSRSGHSSKTPLRHPNSSRPPVIDTSRYRRVRRFFVRVALHFVWWDIILNRPGLKRFRTPYLTRWQMLAREYRILAVELGGVLIKLGQFLSTRVDILPPEITGELGELQDAVPPVPVAEVIAQIEADFGRPLDELFSWFDSEAIGAASVAQAHKARLITGESVAVKVLRPGIVTVVETDLKVIGKFIKRIKHYRPIRRFVDLDRLAVEFTTVTARELDLVVEAESAERFARDFAAEAAVYVPRIYWDYTAPHTLTMEDVSYIKIDDRKAIDAAGISRTEIVEKLFDIYQEQIVVTHFVHADPHAGNLFIRPLPHADELVRYGLDFKFKPGDPVPYYPDRPFQVVFVDFGMAVAIPKRLWVSLRNYIIGIGTEDAHLIVESYREGGVLLGDSDLKQIEEFTAALLEKFSGSLLGQMKDVDLRAYADLYGEYQSLLYESPFQFQSDLLFVMRALGILSGLATELAPDFDPFARVKPFAQRLIQEEWQPHFDEIGKVGPRFLRLPASLFDVLDQAQRGQLSVQTHLPPDARRTIDQLQRSISRLTLMLAAVGLLIVGTIWHVGGLIAAAAAGNSTPPNGIGVWIVAAGGLIFLVSLFKTRFR